MPALKEKEKDPRIAKLSYECIPTGRRNVHRTRNKWAEKHIWRYSKKLNYLTTRYCCWSVTWLTNLITPVHCRQDDIKKGVVQKGIYIIWVGMRPDNRRDFWSFTVHEWKDMLLVGYFGSRTNTQPHIWARYETVYMNALSLNSQSNLKFSGGRHKACRGPLSFKQS
jgi:hypothetical protein